MLASLGVDVILTVSFDPLVTVAQADRLIDAAIAVISLIFILMVPLNQVSLIESV